MFGLKCLLPITLIFVMIINLSDAKLRTCNTSSIEYVFVAIVSPSHYPADYSGGFQLFNRSSKDKNTTLLMKGAEFAYNLGQHLRKTYFLNETSKDFFRIYNSTQKRFKQTAYLLSLGLENQTFNHSNYTATQNYTIASDTNKSIDGRFLTGFLNKTTCPEFFNRTKNLSQSDQNLKIILKDFHDRTKENLTRPSKPNEVSNATMEDIYKLMVLYEVMVMKREAGKRLDEYLGYWSDDDIDKLRRLTNRAGFVVGSNKIIQKIVSGRLLHEVLNHMDHVRQNKSITENVTSTIRLVIFPAPHMTLATLIGIFSGYKTYTETVFYPHLGAMFVIELHKSCCGKVWYFKVFYKSQENNKLREAILPKSYDSNDAQTIYRDDASSILSDMRVESDEEIEKLCKPNVTRSQKMS